MHKVDMLLSALMSLRGELNEFPFPHWVCEQLVKRGAAMSQSILGEFANVQMSIEIDHGNVLQIFQIIQQAHCVWERLIITPAYHNRNVPFLDNLAHVFSEIYVCFL